MIKKKKITETRQSNGKHMIQGAGPGRPKGSKNAVNKAIVDDVITTYKRLGGTKYLATLAKGDRTDRAIWGALVNKLMPAKIEAEVTGKLTWDQIIAGNEG